MVGRHHRANVKLAFEPAGDVVILDTLSHLGAFSNDV
jgi:hypothetical protein